MYSSTQKMVKEKERRHKIPIYLQENAYFTSGRIFILGHNFNEDCVSKRRKKANLGTKL